MLLVVFLQQPFHFDNNTRIRHNLVRSEDHLTSNASLAFPPKTLDRWFSAVFFLLPTPNFACRSSIMMRLRRIVYIEGTCRRVVGWDFEMNFRSIYASIIVFGNLYSP